MFGRPNLEVVSDTVSHSFGRAFVTGLLGQILLLPTFGMLVVGLILSVAGILLLPFAVAVYALLVVVGVVGGYLAVAHAMGETYTRRRMALGVVIGSPNSYRYLLVGLVALASALGRLGHVRLGAGGRQASIWGAAFFVTWLLGTAGFGAALLSRAGIRENFAGRLHPARGAHRRIPLGHAAVRRAGGAPARHPDSHRGASDVRASLLAAGARALGGRRRRRRAMRPFTTYRQLHGETRLDGAAGVRGRALRLAPGRPDELYRMDVSYDDDRYRAGERLRRVEPARSVLGLTAAGKGGLRVVSRNQLRQTASRHLLSPGDLALDLALGAVDADLELGGLRVTDLDLETGASRATVRFSQPNGSPVPPGNGQRRRGGAHGARPGQQPVRPDRLRGRHREG